MTKLLEEDKIVAMVSLETDQVAKSAQEFKNKLESMIKVPIGSSVLFSDSVTRNLYRIDRLLPVGLEGAVANGYRVLIQDQNRVEKIASIGISEKSDRPILGKVKFEELKPFGRTDFKETFKFENDARAVENVNCLLMDMDQSLNSRVTSNALRGKIA